MPSLYSPNSSFNVYSYICNSHGCKTVFLRKLIWFTLSLRRDDEFYAGVNVNPHPGTRWGLVGKRRSFDRNRIPEGVGHWVRGLGGDLSWAGCCEVSGCSSQRSTCVLWIPERVLLLFKSSNYPGSRRLEPVIKWCLFLSFFQSLVSRVPLSAVTKSLS